MSTWGQQNLRVGDRVRALDNSNLSWLVIGRTETQTFLLYASPEHRKAGMLGRTGQMAADCFFDETIFLIERKDE